MSFNTRRIIALTVVLLASTVGGLLAMELSDWQFAALVGVVLGAAVGLVFVLIWANQSL